MQLQEPYGPPGLSEETVVLTPGKESFVSLRAHATYTTRAALKLTPQERKCYVRSEGVLKHFRPEYSHEACVLDHRTTLLLKDCGCKEYNHPGSSMFILYTY
ncbi:hypothetical protein SK128_003376 [Halocaridina rubra]|uniref:Uncharacterized protein n=1 Tax=Halocaridina rubra TaxID=373956 RepID=A0AAN8WJI1_HALRR